MLRTIKNAKFVQSKSRGHEVKHVFGGTVYQVTSGTSGNAYTVRLNPNGGAMCDCPWGQYRPRSTDHRSGCSHVIAVFDYIEHERRVSAWTDEDQARRQHRPVIDLGDGVMLTSRKVGT